MFRSSASICAFGGRAVARQTQMRAVYQVRFAGTKGVPNEGPPGPQTDMSAVGGMQQGTDSATASSTNDLGMGKTHAKDDGEDSIVPKPIQKAVPEAVERALPDSIHNTGDSKTHAKAGGEDSVVPKSAQKAVPEGVERALPDSVHNTGDSKK